MVSEDRRNGKPGRRDTDELVKRIETMELAVGAMGKAIQGLVEDFRDFKKETDGLRRAERIASLARVFMTKFARCSKHAVDITYRAVRWVIVRASLVALGFLAWQAYKRGSLVEWLAKLWP